MRGSVSRGRSATLQVRASQKGRDTTFGMKEQILKTRDGETTDSFWAGPGHSFPPCLLKGGGGRECVRVHLYTMSQQLC
jgi:hypothetical protein